MVLNHRSSKHQYVICVDLIFHLLNMTYSRMPTSLCLCNMKLAYKKQQRIFKTKIKHYNDYKWNYYVFDFHRYVMLTESTIPRQKTPSTSWSICEDPTAKVAYLTIITSIKKRNLFLWNCREYIDGLVQSSVSPVRYQWIYCSLALSHRYVFGYTMAARLFISVMKSHNTSTILLI